MGNTISLVACVKPKGFCYDSSHRNSIITKDVDNILAGRYTLRFGDEHYTNLNHWTTVLPDTDYPYCFKGDIDDTSIYNRRINDESKVITGNYLTSCPQKNDFSFSRNACTPLDVSFATNATGFDNISWDFGDGNTASGLTVAPHTYGTTGNYLITMITTYPTCADTVKKTITVDVQTDNLLIATIDTTICYGTSKQLLATQGFNFCWTPTTGLDNPNSPTPIASPLQTTTYFYQSTTTEANLISNGNFSAGNTGFTSQYLYTSSNNADGQYYVGTSPQAWYFAHYPCTDHTTGNGNMLLVNGSSTPDLEVWKTTTTVTPNTNYTFSVWICSISTPSPAELAFSINGNNIGGQINGSLPPCTWVQFYTTWNSGDATSAIVSVINKNTAAFGNDFALDDISFAPFSVKRDSVKITVDTALITTSANSIICEGNNVQLTSSGGTSYSWTPATGLSNPNTGNPVASPIVTTQYIVTGTNANNCSANDTVVISVNPKPVVTITADTTICQNASLQLLATGGVSYSWTPANSLDNAAIANPVATPTSLTKYIVTVTNSYNCTAIDSVQVGIRSLTNFTINPPTDLCLKDSIQLSAGGGDTYAWSPAGSLDNASIANPAASPLQTTTYSVLITDTVCTNSTTLSTTITVLPLPNVKAFKSNDIDCSSNQSQLSATGAVQYSWTPSVSLNNGNLSNPVASPAITTQYIVTGTDAAGCHNNDSILVLVNATNKGGYLMPTAFTPNNDGMNDCFGIKYWGTILELEFSVYNRWGERVFFTRNPGDCWDGRYKGIAQDPAVFVYTIKAKTSCEENVFRKGTFTLIR